MHFFTKDLNKNNYSKIINELNIDLKELKNIIIQQKSNINKCIQTDESINTCLRKLEMYLSILNSMLYSLNSTYPYTVNLFDFFANNNDKLQEIYTFTKNINDNFLTNHSTNHINNDIIENIPPENTLLISSKNNVVYLPYKANILENMLKSNPNLSKLEIIKKYFSKPFNYYKNPFVSRFKEAFSLMKNKQHSSVFAAIELATELFFNYNLHPAIISACENIDELDIYLDYLDNGQTQKFKCFNIIFEIAPIVSNRHKKN